MQHICLQKIRKSFTPHWSGISKYPSLHSINEATQNQEILKPPDPALHRPDSPEWQLYETNDTGVCSTMRLYLQVALVICIHTAPVLGLYCMSGCAACWRENDENGMDTKFTCTVLGGCGNKCPSGYHDIHCAKYDRCK